MATLADQLRLFFERDKADTDVDTLKKQVSALRLQFGSGPQHSAAKLSSFLELGLMLGKIHNQTHELSDLNLAIEHFHKGIALAEETQKQWYKHPPLLRFICTSFYTNI
jgi:hypothetical protein